MTTVIFALGLKAGSKSHVTDLKQFLCSILNRKDCHLNESQIRWN